MVCSTLIYYGSFCSVHHNSTSSGDAVFHVYVCAYFYGLCSKYGFLLMLICSTGRDLLKGRP